MPLAEHQRSQYVSALTSTQFEDFRVVGGAFDSAVPRSVVRFAVVVVLTVGFVVLLVVRDEVVQGETVVSDDEVDARARATSGGLVEIRGSGET